LLVCGYFLRKVMNYIEVDFETANEEQSEQLIALLDAAGFTGFEESGNTLRAYISEHEFSEEDFTAIIAMFDSIAYTQTVVENINWNQQWEESFEPVLVDDFVAIRAGFHPSIINVEHEIVITPKMSFGTGHHATTYLVMQAMRSLDIAGKTVIDFGTGTGVLAILAEKIGASELLAIDNDDWSIENAKENIAQNNCTKIVIEKGDVFPTDKKYDIILANITLNVILANLSFITSAAKPGTKILFSGFLKNDEATLIEALEKQNLNYLSSSQKGEWMVVLAEN
jgi:ribosomal protein L11 methyltransferase